MLAFAWRAWHGDAESRQPRSASVWASFCLPPTAGNVVRRAPHWEQGRRGCFFHLGARPTSRSSCCTRTGMLGGGAQQAACTVMMAMSDLGPRARVANLNKVGRGHVPGVPCRLVLEDLPPRAIDGVAACSRCRGRGRRLTPLRPTHMTTTSATRRAEQALELVARARRRARGPRRPSASRAPRRPAAATPPRSASRPEHACRVVAAGQLASPPRRSTTRAAYDPTRTAASPSAGDATTRARRFCHARRVM